MQENTDEILYYLVLNNEQAGPYTPGQLRAMWQNGAVNAKTPCCPAGGASWEPLVTFRTVVESPASQFAPISSAPQLASVAGPPHPRPTKVPSAILRYGGGFIVLCVAYLIYSSFTGTNGWFGRTMPLTEEMSLLYFQKMMKKAEEAAMAHMAKEAKEDLTTKQSPKDTEAYYSEIKLKMPSAVMSEMGYNYNLTVRKIATSRATIAAHKGSGLIGGDLLLSIADSAFDNRTELLAAGIIDQKTVSALEAMPKIGTPDRAKPTPSPGR